jgi:hypothetical protein
MQTLFFISQLLIFYAGSAGIARAARRCARAADS